MPSTALAAELLVRVRTTWRHFASPVTLLAALAAHWALVPRTRDRPAALSSSSGNCREAAHAWAPHHTKFLHQYCSYVNPSGSCMWKKKIERVVFTCTKVAKPHNSPWAQVKAFFSHWESFHQFSEGFELGPDEVNFQNSFSPETEGFTHSTGFLLLQKHFSGLFVFIVVVELLMPKHWDQRNFST